MAAAMRHRGPDAFGCYRDRRIGIAHARLSIVDLDGGSQPLANEDESIWVAFNGEIFDFVELREELLAKGHRFRTRSDTEVIAHAWETWGEGAFDRFNGQWAIAIWDARREQLVLARDRVGVRPLHIHESDEGLWFASEVKSLFVDPRVPRAIDPHGLDDTFTFWSALAPRTPFRGIEELPAGHFAVIDARKRTRRTVRYWDPSYPTRDDARLAGRRRDIESAAAELREHLREATRLRIVRADVPVGSYLSGGLDSSLVAALGREAAPGRFQTFSLRFADAEFDETRFQREMAARLGSEHHEIVVSRDDIARVFPAVIAHTERPILRTAPAPLYLLSGLVREHGIKVVLTGEGADEMLGGYDLFREAKVRRFWAKFPASALRPRLFEKLYPYLARSPAHARGMALKFWARGLERSAEPTFSHEPRWQSARALQRLFAADMRAQLASRDPIVEIAASLPEAFATWEPLAQAQYLEVRTLLSSYLLASQGDRMLMGHSVEGRFPFLDRDVMAFANALPASFKLHGLDEKHVLKRAAHGLVPESIVRRTKQPYRAPDALAFVGGQRVPDYVRDSLSERAVREAGIFDPTAVAAMAKKCESRARQGDDAFSNADNMGFVGVLSTMLLHESFIRRPIDAGGEVRWMPCIDRLKEASRDVSVVQVAGE
jgi:asparagine synthase (glutamine-hydrolysing)